MSCYSNQRRDWIFVTGYRFFSSAKNKSKNIGKNKYKILSDKYYQKLLDYDKNLQQIHFKLLKKE